MVAEISLTRGYVTIVDDEWFDRLTRMPWHVVVKRSGKAYARACIYIPVRRRRWIWMHRLIMDAPDILEVDHIDGNALNNTTANLRLATREQNARNRKGWRLGLKGVQPLAPNTFQAKITINKKKTALGCFKTEVEAALAYDRAAKQWYGEFASLNFPDQQYSLPPFAHEDIGHVEALKCTNGISDDRRGVRLPARLWRQRGQEDIAPVRGRRRYRKALALRARPIRARKRNRASIARRVRPARTIGRRYAATVGRTFT